MKHRKQPKFEQLDLFGLSTNENYFTSEAWGRLEFFPTKSDDPRKTCCHCLLRNSKECATVKCQATERQDGKNGYFSIHDFPIIKT